VELLTAAARQLLAAGLGVLDVGSRRVPGGPPLVIPSQVGCLAGALSGSAARIGSEDAASIAAQAATARF
jgi:hypothetical protein